MNRCPKCRKGTMTVMHFVTERRCDICGHEQYQCPICGKWRAASNTTYGTCKPCYNALYGPDKENIE